MDDPLDPRPSRPADRSAVLSRARWERLRAVQPIASTAREVGGFAHASGGRVSVCEVGATELHDGVEWTVGGIFEPASWREPWVVCLLARHGGDVVVRNPSVLVPSDAVIRVRDGLTFPE